MKVSINKANKIRNQLEGLKLEFAVSVNVMTTDTPEEATKAAMDGEVKLRTTLQKVSQKIAFLYQLRTIINNANHEHGITPIIARIAEIEHLIKSHTDAMGTAKASAYRSVFLEQFLKDQEYTAEMTALDQSKKPRPQRVELSILDDHLVEWWKGEIIKWKLLSQKLQEERNARNHSNYIELPEDMVAFLTEQAIV